MKKNILNQTLIFDGPLDVTFKSLMDIVKEIESCSYVGTNGNINESVSFQDLKKYAENQKKHPLFVLSLIPKDLSKSYRDNVGILKSGTPFAFKEIYPELGWFNRWIIKRSLWKLRRLVWSLDYWEKTIMETKK